ncbi:MAG: DUF4440 domain-containing protein [Nevskiaceae bacterium]|nr:MAG: DUF4440 domain-containing protein [Nevskiaceae bacterium]
MRLPLRGLLILVAAAALPLQTQAAKKTTSRKATPPAPVVAPAQAEIGPAGIVDDFHELLRQGKRAEVLALLTEDAVVFETGYAGQSRDDYAQNHVSDDADFAGVTDYQVQHRQVLQEGETAWVLTQATVQGIFGDQNVDLQQTETMILRHRAEGWRIAHIHWSAHSRPIPEEPQPGAAAPAAPSTPAPQDGASLQLAPTTAVPAPAVPPSPDADSPRSGP